MDAKAAERFRAATAVERTQVKISRIIFGVLTAVLQRSQMKKTLKAVLHRLSQLVMEPVEILQYDPNSVYSIYGRLMTIRIRFAQYPFKILYLNYILLFLATMIQNLRWRI